MKKLFFIGALAGSLGAAVLAQEAKPQAYQNNFEQAAVDSVPDDFLVLDGGFTVKEDAGNKFLELPGAPLESFGVLFGPTLKENQSVTARIHGISKGRRFPQFGVGLNGVGGYKLLVSPAKKAIELYKGDNAIATTPYEWQTDKWAKFFLQVRKVKDGEWKVEGKVWTEGGEEPKEWLITYDETTAPLNGRAMITGRPYAGTPIRYDDFMVSFEQVVTLPQSDRYLKQ